MVWSTRPNMLFSDLSGFELLQFGRRVRNRLGVTMDAKQRTVLSPPVAHRVRSSYNGKAMRWKRKQSACMR